MGLGIRGANGSGSCSGRIPQASSSTSSPGTPTDGFTLTINPKNAQGGVIRFTLPAFRIFKNCDALFSARVVSASGTEGAFSKSGNPPSLLWVDDVELKDWDWDRNTWVSITSGVVAHWYAEGYYDIGYVNENLGETWKLGIVFDEDEVRGKTGNCTGTLYLTLTPMP